MKHNFDEIINRRASECKKYEPSYPQDVIPMWIADTDFAVPKEISEAIQERAQHPCFGYPVESFEFEKAAAILGNETLWMECGSFLGEVFQRSASVSDVRHPCLCLSG